MVFFLVKMTLLGVHVINYSSGYLLPGYLYTWLSLRTAQNITDPQSAIRNPQSAIRNPQSAIRNPQSAIRNPYSLICNCRSD
jgi:hypothetical protein